MGKINNKDAWSEGDLKRLKSLKNKDKWECSRCQNQTFVIYEVSDFPFFDCICSQCGCIHIRK